MFKTMGTTKFWFAGILFACLCGTLSSSASANQNSIEGKKELKVALKTAKTSEDHQRIAEFYQEEARKLKGKEKEEQELADYYLAHPSIYGKMHPTPYHNHKDLAHYYQQASDHAATQAEEHQKLAAQSGVR